MGKGREGKGWTCLGRLYHDLADSSSSSPPSSSLFLGGGGLVLFMTSLLSPLLFEQVVWMEFITGMLCWGIVYGEYALFVK